MTDTREQTTFTPENTAPKRGRFARSEATAPQRGRFVRSATPATVDAPQPETRAPRPRHEVPSAVRPLLRPFFRYSYSREAWVLLGIGSRRGPVIRDL